VHERRYGGQKHHCLYCHAYPQLQYDLRVHNARRHAEGKEITGCVSTITILTRIPDCNVEALLFVLDAQARLCAFRGRRLSCNHTSSPLCHRHRKRRQRAHQMSFQQDCSGHRGQREGQQLPRESHDVPPARLRVRRLERQSYLCLVLLLLRNLSTHLPPRRIIGCPLT
jgi:hypothetical protein